jgi:hypothetical protein
MQQKLDSFFKIIPKYDEKNKKCFIYDPENYKAFFDTKPATRDKFITTKLGIKLFYRKPETDKNIDIPIIKCRFNAPLIKSNLQKAIRRCDNLIAIQSALVLIQMAPMELLRRLPIIYIEDVCLMNSYPIVVWLMMADKDYGKLTKMDIDIILNIVNSLCNCRSYFDYKAENHDNSYVFTHESLQFCPNSDELLSLYYRSEYGGMKGDIQMLKVSIDYYKMNSSQVRKTVYNSINYNLIEREIEVLVEAIDFHCFPNMLNTLNRITYIDKETIKKCIWFVESGYNVRKNDTILSSKEYEERNEWKKIEKHMDDVRCDLIK